MEGGKGGREGGWSEVKERRVEYGGREKECEK